MVWLLEEKVGKLPWYNQAHLHTNQPYPRNHSKYFLSYEPRSTVLLCKYLPLLNLSFDSRSHEECRKAKEDTLIQHSRGVQHPAIYLQSYTKHSLVLGIRLKQKLMNIHTSFKLYLQTPDHKHLHHCKQARVRKCRTCSRQICFKIRPIIQRLLTRQ